MNDHSESMNDHAVNNGEIFLLKQSYILFRIYDSYCNTVFFLISIHWNCIARIDFALFTFLL